MRLILDSRQAITFIVGACLFGAGFVLWYSSNGTTAVAEDTVQDEEFAVPETDDVEKLLTFIEDIRDQRPPQPRGPAEYRAYVKYQRSAPVAIAKASEKILAKAKPDSTDYADASAFLLESKVMGFREADEEEREKIFQDVLQHMKDYGVRRDEAGVAYGISQALEGQDPKLAAKAYGEFAKLVKTSKVEEIRDLAHLFEGPSRRLGLLGSEMEVFGKTLDGKEVDWESYRGKVVLVDFWATWCGPCLAEIPNLKEAYEKYHDKGFEIVGVNIDDRRFAVDQYLAKNPSPWPHLHQEEEGNALAEHYGVNAIPFIVLVGKDGKVISTDARGRKSHEHTDALIGATEDSA